MEQIEDSTSDGYYGPSFYDNKQHFSIADNDNQNKDSLVDSRTILQAQPFVEADPLRDWSSALFLPHVVKQSQPESTTYTLAGANDNSLAHLDFQKLNIKTTAPPSSSFPTTSQNFATPPPPLPLNSDDTTTNTGEFSTSSPPSFFLNFNFNPSSSSLIFSPPSTPTHKPIRPRIITSAMSRRVANLPTGKGGAPTNVPQFLSVGTNLSTDSTDSQGSVRTQVPGSYHQQHVQQQAIQEEQWYGQINNGALPFATPDLNSSSTFVSAVQPGKGLNPNVQPFAPPSQSGYGSQFGSPSMGFAGMGMGAQKAGSFAPVNNGYSTQIKTASAYAGINGAYVPPQKQISDYGVAVDGGFDRRGSIGGYQSQNGGYAASNAYGQGNGAVQYSASGHYGGARNGGPHAYNTASNATSYGHYGQGAAMNGYGFHGGQAENGYANNTNYGVGGPNQTFQNGQYGSAVANGYAPPGQAWGGQYQGHNQYAVQAPYTQPSNVNRGKSVYYGSAKPNAAAPPYTPSNLTTAPVVSANNQVHHPEIESHEYQNGGPVRPPSQTPSRVNSASPTKSKASTVNSSAEPTSSLPSGSNEEKAPGPGSPTPVVRRQEFNSEPRNSRTPTLRSRRGQTLIPSTDPSNKQAMVNWLENVSPAPPPKMSSLELAADSKLSGGDILAQAGITLPSVNAAGLGLRSDADPFTTTTAVQRATPIKPALNPFAPLPQHLSPYTGGGLLQKPAVSAPLRRLTANGKPAISDALEPANLPMVEYCRMAREDTWGVIKIKNIPYSVNRPEVLAFLGRNARIINEQDFEPVHIVMERVTSKTLDCYVEFISFNEAVNAVNRFEMNRTGGRGGRLGQRHVEVELSCQEQLMHDLFPKAKNVTWSGSRPIIKDRDPNDQYNSGFQGFISKEELVMLVKHVEAPQRVSIGEIKGEELLLTWLCSRHSRRIAHNAHSSVLSAHCLRYNGVLAR